MHLAQELVDYTIDLLNNDPVTLILVSLVSRAWVCRTLTQDHTPQFQTLVPLSPSSLIPLCEKVRAPVIMVIMITTYVDFCSIYFTLDSDPVEFLLSPQQRLTIVPSVTVPLSVGRYRGLPAPHITWKGHDDPSSVLDCFELSEPHTLAINFWELHNPDEETIRRCFAKFPGASITTLELHSVSLTHRTLLTFLSMFPNVDNLTVTVGRWWTDLSAYGPFGDSTDETFQRVSLPRSRGSFKFDQPDNGLLGLTRGKFLSAVAILPLQFQIVSLDLNAPS